MRLIVRRVWLIMDWDMSWRVLSGDAACTAVDWRTAARSSVEVEKRILVVRKVE